MRRDETLFKDLSQMVQAQMKDDEVRYTIQGSLHFRGGQVKQWEMNSDTACCENSKKVVITTPESKCSM